MIQTVQLSVGDPAPWFVTRSTRTSKHRFDREAGFYAVLTFLRQPRSAASGALLDAFAALGADFAGAGCRLYGVAEANDVVALRLEGSPVCVFHDSGGGLRRLYGVDEHAADAVSYLLSPRLQILGLITEADPARHAGVALEAIRRQVPGASLAAAFGPPPILIIPNVFEPQLCRLLIEGYRAHGGEASGFMVDQDGKTVEKFNDRIKVRRDWHIENQQLNQAIAARFQRRVVPEIRKAYNVVIAHMERHMVGCYAAEQGGHFSAHRDNDTRGTAHRLFACSLNLNAGEYEGGDLCFPEFGPQTYRPPTGGCCIFSCSLLHAAMPVTAGERYVFLPFLHDAASEKVRQENAGFIQSGAPQQAAAAQQPA